MNTSVRPTDTSAKDGPLQNFKDRVLEPALIADTPRSTTLVESLGSVSADGIANIKKGTDLSWVTKKTDRSRLKPTDLFTKHFGGKSLTQEQLITRCFDAPVEVVPQEVVGLIQRRIQGATTRIDTRKIKIQECRVILKTGVIQKHGTSVKMTSSERKSLNDKKLRSTAELIKAKEDLRILRGYLDEALEANSSPLRNNIKTVREAAYNKRVAPSISQRIIDQIVAKPDLKETFLKVKSGEENFLDVLKVNDGKTHKQLLNKSKLTTQVKLRVFEQLS